VGSNPVTVNVSLSQPGVTEEGFGTPLILTQELPLDPSAWTTRTRLYDSADEVLADWGATTAAYNAAAKAFGQNPQLQALYIGRALTNPTTQTWGAVVAQVIAGASYTLWISDPTGAANRQAATYVAPTVTAFVASGTFPTGDVVTADTGKFYFVSVGGTDSDSAGPTGTSASQTVGGLTYLYIGANTLTNAQAQNDAICLGLKAAITALTDLPTATPTVIGSAGSKTLLVTGTATGWVGVETNDPTLITTSQNHVAPSGGGLATDLAACQNETNGWYGLVTLLNSNAYVIAAATWIATQQKLYIVATSDTTDATAGTGPQANLKAGAYGGIETGTGGIFHPRASEFMDAAEIGRWFNIPPGGDNWLYKTLSGVTSGWGNGQQYTASQIAFLNASLANWYGELGGINVVQGQGLTCFGEYIDVVRFLGWYVAQVVEGGDNLLIGNEKIPFTDAGIAMIVAMVKAINEQGAKPAGAGPGSGGINPGSPPGIPAPSVTAPSSGSVSSTDRQNRVLNGVVSSFTLAGAINTMVVNVQVSQ